jgi:NAD(P)-dependent dehydrogenase (short-subunit alcohol dehydrogenase family)
MPSVLITGTSTGIGRATALHLDGLGFQVFAGVRKAADGDALRAAASPHLTPVLLDVTDEPGIAAAVATVEGALAGAGLDGLVNNAGILTGGPVEFLDLAEVRRVFDVNLFGPIRVTQAFMPLLRRARGRVVHVSSVGGQVAIPYASPYAASKFALEALADAQRLELRSLGMHVSIIEPGMIATPILDKANAGSDTLREALPEEARALYEKGMRAVQETFAKGAAQAGAPETVARAIEHALTARRPRTRYPVGMDALMQLTLRRVLPDRVFDAFLTRFMGLPRWPAAR